eukprot:TRINITY_DN254_c0_g1_i1.p3 TRINITY_DN254_c0_g1~~TRINITY_DN254_c0_g1_i1.p3  ORF type:complete len:148 (-),score=11.64 TRINITY_DN254_c0_g1_i1:46-489(-)
MRLFVPTETIQGWSSIYDEYIPSDSPRLAPVSFFTGREDIPRYLLNGNGNCRFAYVVVGREAENRLTEQLMDLARDEFQAQDIMMSQEAGLDMDVAEDYEENQSNEEADNDASQENTQQQAEENNEPNPQSQFAMFTTIICVLCYYQ